MGLFDQDDPESVYSALSKLEARIGLPDGFCEALREEKDDWSFVIKLHALFEAALSQLLIAHLGRPELGQIIALIDMGHRQTGKLQFAKALGALDERERGYIRYLSELRNELVHNVSNVTFSFEEHVKSLDANQKTRLLGAVRWFSKDAPAEVKQFLLKTIRTHVWTTGMMTLAVMSAEMDVRDKEREGAALLLEQAALSTKLHEVLVEATAAAKASVSLDAHLDRPPDEPLFKISDDDQALREE